ncbi:MAG: hypothetical protein ACD_58C00297G0007 [uncultured bacterium]|nr:MAG: hypothetical protein ACD_58C00297G0007 [uncultured bacterium]
MIDTKNIIIKNAYQFVSELNEPIKINPDKYCDNRDVFFGRLDKFRIILEKNVDNINISSLLTAVVGEIGNNSYDHNLGNWRDIPGIYFNYDFENKIIVLADRGQGIKKTIQKVIPQIADDLKAINVAFTQTISGRAPEKRGNGLKFVSKIMQENRWGLMFHSGKAKVIIDKPDYKLVFENSDENIEGTIAAICF